MAASSWCAAAPTIHVFSVFCDAYPDEAGRINKSVGSDRVLIDDLFKEHISEQGWGVSLRIREVRGEEATKAEILRQFDAFAKAVGDDDTLYVHFSGHGVIPENAEDTQMLYACDMKLINRKDWADAIRNTNCRLKVFITDCCSNYSKVQVVEGDPNVEPWSNLYFLLIRHRGFVDITAASPGQFAWGTNAGGYLTVNLQSDMQRFSTWREVFEETQGRVFEETSHKSSAQRPFAYSMAERMVDAMPGDSEAPEFQIPDSDRRELTKAELESMGLMQLYLSRNEISARYGHDFSTPLLRRYFSTQSWYGAKKGERDHELSPLEARNARLILEVEKEKGGPFLGRLESLPKDLSTLKDTPEIFPHSSVRYLSRYFVETLSLPQLSLARNEILARNGFPFTNPTLRKYFSLKPGYAPIPDMTDPTLTDVENQNIWLIKKIERIKGGPYIWK